MQALCHIHCTDATNKDEIDWNFNYGFEDGKQSLKISTTSGSLSNNRFTLHLEGADCVKHFEKDCGKTHSISSCVRKAL